MEPESGVSRELRELLLEALEAFRCPAGHDELAAYARVFHGIEVPASALIGLQEFERLSYRAGGQRQVWICPAIVRSYPDFRPDVSLLTRSDWSLTLRLVLEESGAVRQLWLLKQLCGMALAALQSGRLHAEPLIDQITRRAELLLPVGIVEGRLLVLEDGGEAPDAPPEAGWERLEVLRAVAEDAFDQLASVDFEARSRFAKELAQTSQEIQLFGSDHE